MNRIVGSWVAACASIALLTVAGAAGGTFATFTAAASGGPQALTSAHVFPAVRTTVPVAIADNTNGGAETNTTDPYAVAGDGLTATSTGSWPVAFTTTQYLQFGYAFPGYAGTLPAGLAASGATFDFTLSSPAGVTTTFNVETRSIATGTVLGTHTSATYTVTGGSASFSIALPEVTTLDIASDLAIRVYEANSGSTTTTDEATVTVSSPVTSPATTWTTYPMSVTDASSGVAATAPWPLAALDGTFYSVATNWPPTFKTADYIRWQFPTTIVPAGAIITAATLLQSSKDTNNVKFCYYFDVDTTAGAVIATHGSSATPYCNTTGSFTTDTIALPELTTAVDANAVNLLNGMQLKMYGFDTAGTKKSQHDQLRLQVTWYLP